MTDLQEDERVRAVVEEPLSEQGFEVVDIERHGSVLRVTVDLLVGPGDPVDLLVGPGDPVDLLVGPSALSDEVEHESDRPGGIDMDGVTRATRLVSDLLDRHDLVGERMTLEVSSPGIERPLRTPAHFRRFVGTEVAVKLRPGAEGERRLTGALESADDEGVVVGGRRLAYADIDKARTVFVWPAGGQKETSKKVGAKKMGRVS